MKHNRERTFQEVPVWLYFISFFLFLSSVNVHLGVLLFIECLLDYFSVVCYPNAVCVYDPVHCLYMSIGNVLWAYIVKCAISGNCLAGCFLKVNVCFILFLLWLSFVSEWYRTWLTSGRPKRPKGATTIRP